MENNEKLYTPSQWCSYRCEPEVVVEEHVRTVTEESLKVIEEFPLVETLRYGSKPKQLLDIFEPVHKAEDTATFIYIHGGYWQELSREISRYCVRPLLESNIRVIIPGYDLAPEVTLALILLEIEDLAKFIKGLAGERNWKNIWYSGHSAGAHLAASLLCSESLPELNIDGFILISGIYNLEPLIHTSVNKPLEITEENYRSLSPLFRLPTCIHPNLQIFIIVAEYDSPAFHTQSDNFKKEIEKLNPRITMNVIRNTDHFTVVESLKNQDSVLTKIITNAILENAPKP